MYVRTNMYTCLQIYSNLCNDIQELGFDKPKASFKITYFNDKKTGKTTTYRTWSVCKGGAFAYLIAKLGGFVGKKTTQEKNQTTINLD